MSPHWRHRKYEPTEFITLGIGIAFIVFALISLFPLLRMHISWGKFMLFPGCIMIAIYFSNRYRSNRMQREVKAALNSYNSSRIKISALASDLAIKEKDIKAILVDLRTKGEIKFSFDGNTGDIILPQFISTSTTQSSTIPQGNREIIKYCPFCGVKASEPSKFCFSCGASLE